MNNIEYDVKAKHAEKYFGNLIRKFLKLSCLASKINNLKTAMEENVKPSQYHISFVLFSFTILIRNYRLVQMKPNQT